MASKDVDMDKKEESKDVEMEAPQLTPAEILRKDLLADLKLIAEATSDFEFRLFDKLNARIILLRKQMDGAVLARFLDASPQKAGLLPLLPAAAGDEVEPCGNEGQAFLELLTLIYLLDHQKLDEAIVCANLILPRVQTDHKASMRFFAGKIFTYASRAYELKGRLQEIRPVILGAYRSACLHHDEQGQASNLVLLLRNYLHYNLYDQAQKLVSKTSFPETRANAQYARYLFYLGKMKAVQLEYSEGSQYLTQALRKGPKMGSRVGRGFRATATKLSVVVELLMGEIPPRSTFESPELKDELAPYMEITRAVREGDANKFQKALAQYEATFRKDGNLSLIQRLKHTVIKTGLRALNVSYTRISLKDIATKLGLDSAESAQAIVSKAIVDGVIDATIDHAGQFVKSTVKGDLYASHAPQKALHSRTAFLLALHAETVKAMRYPAKKSDDEDAEERRERDRALMAAADAEATNDEDDLFM